MEFSDGNLGIEYVFQFDPSNRLSFKDAYIQNLKRYLCKGT